MSSFILEDSSISSSTTSYFGKAEPFNPENAILKWKKTLREIRKDFVKKN